MNVGLKVFVFVLVVNVVCGFDVLGFVLEKFGDEIIVCFLDKLGLRIMIIIGVKGKFFFEVEKNIVGFVV